MLPIEFRFPGFEPNQVALESIRNIFLSAIEQMGLTEKDIVRVIFTDEEQYGTVIKEISPDSGYTDDGIYRGVGKIVPHFSDVEYAGSTLVLFAGVIEAFIPNPERDQGERENMQYIIYHELGHCLDYRKRPIQHIKKVESSSKSNIKRCFEANSPELLSEYAACFFSAPYLSTTAFRYFADSASENLAKYFQKMEQQRELYLAEDGDLKDVRDAAMIAFWRGQIEFAKIFAFLNGNNLLVPDKNINLHWPGKSNEAGRALQAYNGKLGEAWKKYPDCADRFFEATEETWFTITEAEGYKFERRGEDDYLWLV